jgi:hypothetical protein
VSGSVAMAAVAAVVIVPVGTSRPEGLKVYGWVTVLFIVAVAVRMVLSADISFLTYIEILVSASDFPSRSSLA